MTLCESCQEQPATIHVTEIAAEDTTNGADAGDAMPGPVGSFRVQNLCAGCAQNMNLPHTTVKKTAQEIIKLLQLSAQRNRRESGVACPDCGMTLLEFRQKGRMGCARDYEVFGQQARDLLERIHGATKHVGRAPGLAPDDLERIRRATELERELENAIRDEAYERAARLRDELRSLRPR
jgi:protein arginine kinase activator